MKSRVPRIFVFVPVVLLLLYGHAQHSDTYLKSNLTTNTGLPSDEVYHIVADENQILWMATDNGLVRYNGKDFQIFTTSDGLPNNEVLQFFKQHDGTIYGLCKYNRYFIIRNNKIMPYEFNDIVQSILSDYAKTYSIYVDEQGTIHLGTSHGYYCINRKGEILVQDPYINGDTVYSALSFIRYSGQLVAYTSMNHDPVFTDLKDVSGTDSICINKSVRNNSAYEYSYSTAIEADRYAIIHNGMVYCINASGVKQVISTKSRPVSLGWYDSSLWVGTIGNGMYKFKRKGDSLCLHDHILDGLTVTSICKDFQGGYWFSTRESGIFHLNDFNLETFFESKRTSYISAFARVGNHSVIGFDDGKVHFPEDSALDLEMKSNIVSLSGDDYDHLRIYCTGREFEYDLNYGKLEMNPLFTDASNLSVVSSVKLNENQVAYFSIYYFLIYDYSIKEFVYRFDFESKTFFKDVLLTGDHLIIGTSRDVIRFNWKTLQTEESLNMESHVVSLMEFQNKLLVACKDGNIYMTSGYKLSSPDTFPSESNAISDAVVFNDQLIIATNSGIQKYRFDAKEEKWVNSTSIYLLGIVKIEVLEGKLYYVTKDKVIVDNSIGSEKIVPITRIESFKINGSEFLDSTNEFAYDENNIVFKVNAISYSAPFRNYKFQLMGIDQESRYSSDSYINYPSLAPGEYEFVISATANGVDYSESDRVIFTILPPFWKTIWFLVIMIAVGSGLLILGFRYRIRTIQSKLILQKSIVELKSRALTSQLNPHLVFNILNSIQGIISKGEIENANRYLARFSKFMRQSLALSKKTRISLQQEIEITQTYIDLELLRFPEQLDISITNEVSGSDHLVPPLIIQPFVENAIKHGIMPSKRERGKIHIHFREDNHVLIICIEDNGVGFTGDIDFSKGDGMRISKERLEVLNPKNEVTLDADKARTKIILSIYP